MIMSSFILWRIILLLLLLLSMDMREGGGGAMKQRRRSYEWPWPWIGVSWAAAAEVSVSSSPLSGSRIRIPWNNSNGNIPSPHDVFNDTILAKLLDVGACHVNDAPEDFSYVPPLDGSSHSDTVCQEDHGMRFVLYDLQLVNLAAVDALSGSFTAQLQLVFHWTDAWEESYYMDYFAYMGDEITTADIINIVDIINPYASRTWMQLNHGFLEANIIDGISGINLSPDDKVDGWTIKDLIVSNACGTQQSWIPTFLTQDYLLQYLGADYTSQNKSIYKAFQNLNCAGINTLNSENDVRASLSNPANIQPYVDTRRAYIDRLQYTIAEYKKCNAEFNVKFTWNSTINNNTRPPEIQYFELVEDNINRSFNFLDFRQGQEPKDGVNFQCVIHAIANLTTPGIRITIITQRYTTYYIVKLILPTCACVAFSFTAFGLEIDDLLGRLTVVVPSAIALSALQGFVVATDIPAITYMAPTTVIILISYFVQLLIAFESIGVKHWCAGNFIYDFFARNEWKRRREKKEGQGPPETDLTNLASLDETKTKQRRHYQKMTKPSRIETCNDEERDDANQAKPRKIFDRCFWMVLVAFYMATLLIFVLFVPWWRSRDPRTTQYPEYNVSLWNKKI